MLKPHAVCSSLLLIIASLGTALGQNEVVKSDKGDHVTVTASATGARVRLAAFPSVAQIRLDVYDAIGKKVFDNELRGANVLDWHLEDGQAEHLRDETYLCVVTVKSLSGKLTQRIGSLTIEKSSATVQALDASQLTTQQSQTVGPIEENASLLVLRDDDDRTTTVIAHNGEEGQIIRGRGALSFRIGDFFSGKDTEQMRLTAEGNLGIGITHPLVRLDVDGLVRASQGIVFPDGSIQYSAATKTYGAKSSLPDPSFQSIQSRKKSTGGQEHIDVLGTGTLNHIAKWKETGGNGTLGDTGIFETDGGDVGIGTTSPIVKLDVNGALNLRVANLYLNGALRFTDSAVYTNFVAKNGNMTNFDGVNYEQLNLYNPGGDKAIHLGQTVAGSEISSIGTGNTNLALQPSGGTVSIGANAPATKLDVNGDINTSTQYNIGGSRVLSTTGTNNLFAGFSAGQANTTGQQNVFVGPGAGQTNDVATGNSFFGYQAGQANTGGGNSFFGATAGVSNTKGGVNSFFGVSAGINNTTGTNNSFFGANVGLGNSSGAGNSFFGSCAGAINTTGRDNSFFGALAGTLNTTGVNNTAVGTRANVGNTNLDHATVIGADAVVSSSNTIVLGRTSEKVVVPGTMLVGQGSQPVAQMTVATIPLLPSAAAVCFNSAGDLLQCGGSSLRWKTNVRPFRNGLEIIRRLSPISFNWKEGGQPDIGLGAEDVAKVAPSLTFTNSKGEAEGVKYDRLNILLINAVKQQQQQIERQQIQLKQQRDQIDGLKNLICRGHRRAAVCN